MREINVRNEIQIQMYKHNRWRKGRMRYAGFLSVAVCLLSACHTNTQYHVYQPVLGEEGWQKADTVAFDLPPEVPAGTYQLEVGIRHTGAYPYRDIWLSVTQVDGDSLPSHTDTLHIYLADEKGQWQHEGAVGGLFQATYVWDKPVVWGTDSLGRSFRIAHLMRKNPLPGISDVGVRLFFSGRVDAEEHK